MCQVVVKFDSGRDLVIFEVAGQIDLPVLMKAADDHYSSYKTYRTIWDLREADGSNLSFNEMRTVYSEQKSRNIPEDGPQSALIVNNEASLGLARLYGVMTETEETAMRYEAFLEMEDAMAWLGLMPVAIAS
jgi:hypothetical protein